ncbi:hypothetical protein GGX14DRAFT_331122, partial [Mycena pura]
AQLLQLTLTAEEATRQLYGPVLCDSNPVSVYVAVSGRDPGKPYSKAGFALYWGPADARNVSFRLEEGSESRAALVAVLQAVLMVPQDCSLVVYSSSQYAIRTYCYWAGEYAMAGWPCAHGDIVQAAAKMIRNRSAPL